ncbi:PREDICTED: microtubule-associated protein 10-like [Elephantulus edwardii]|uniref:microtubule-associated protein 10-like n=1 Tax=Elephantulus edwardii TaxID=28737 RepID=UPI0003F0772F|nr:PREDICTED: microtubule-associated protein 10-like [Elephantulus edwardii]
MAPLPAESLFSLELLVDWLCLEAGVLPAPVAAAEEAVATPPSSPLCLVAFRLLDFPTLLVYPPGSPAPRARPGMVSFGRGKSCLFRLHPLTLRSLLLQTPLSVMALQLTPGDPPATPRLLGSCGVSLATAARKVLDPTASARSHGHQGSFPLCSSKGQRIGDIALRYRLTDLGSSSLERPLGPAGRGQAEGHKAGELSTPHLRGEQQPSQLAAGPSPGDGSGHLADLTITMAQEDGEDIVVRRDGSPEGPPAPSKGKTKSAARCSNPASRCESPNQEELDMETNTFCPPPLYYTHLTPEKTPPTPGKIAFAPQIHAPEELGDMFQEQFVNPPAHSSPVKYVNAKTSERLSGLMSHPTHSQDVGASNPTPSPSHTEQNRINTIRQLPLLNALLIELSMLYNQPLTNPTHIHPHLAWLYRPEDTKAPDSNATSLCKAEPKDRLTLGEKEKSARPLHRKSQVENAKKSVCLEKKSSIPPKRVPGGTLLYGITNTLKLRLKQTNPDMLVVHEKREQYRKSQMLGTKFRTPSSKVKVLNFTEYRKSNPLPEGQCLALDASFAENSNASRQVTGGFDDPSTTKPTLRHATEKKNVDYSGNKTSSGSLDEISEGKSILSEKFTHTNITEGKMEPKVPSQCVFQQDEIIDKIVSQESADQQIKTTGNDILGAGRSESKQSKNSCSESISELKYSDDFTSPGYSEDFSTTEDTSRSVQARESSPEDPEHCHYTSKSSEGRLYIQKNSSEKSSILTPPFSAGSPVHSWKRSHPSQTPVKSFEEASTTSTSDFSSSRWIDENDNQIGKTSTSEPKVIKRRQDVNIQFKTRTDCKSSEKSQSPRTSQVSSYLPSNMSGLKLKALDSSTSDQFEEDSEELPSLNISKQCKDICELVINKLPGYTM